MVLVVAAIAVWQRFCSGSAELDHIVEVTVPGTFSEHAGAGKAHFDQSCAGCHGANAAGSEKGPPLVHRIYQPNHHADYSFVLAATNGVRAHHWGFGDMPPVPGIPESEVLKVAAYIRELQAANGIE